MRLVLGICLTVVSGMAFGDILLFDTQRNEKVIMCIDRTYGNYPVYVQSFRACSSTAPLSSLTCDMVNNDQTSCSHPNLVRINNFREAILAGFPSDLDTGNYPKTTEGLDQIETALRLTSDPTARSTYQRWVDNLRAHLTLYPSSETYYTTLYQKLMSNRQEAIIVSTSPEYNRILVTFDTEVRKRFESGGNINSWMAGSHSVSSAPNASQSPNLFNYPCRLENNTYYERGLQRPTDRFGVCQHRRARRIALL